MCCGAVPCLVEEPLQPHPHPVQPPLLGVEADWLQALLHQVHLQVVLQHRVCSLCNRVELHLEVTTNTWQVVPGLHPSPLQHLGVSHTGQLG